MDGKQVSEEEFPVGPRRYSENLPHGPLPLFAWMKRQARPC